MSAAGFVGLCAALLAVGFVLGLAAEWPALREWRRLALRQSEVLHTDDRTPRRPFRAGPDDLAERTRRHRR